MADPDRCPFCNQPLSTKAARRHLHAAEKKLRREIEGRVKAEAEDMIKRERARREQGLSVEIERLQKQNEELERRLERMSAPVRGRIYEDNVAQELRELFPDDKVTLERKDGDIVQVVMDRSKRAGKILYECKDVSSWNKRFVSQIKADGKTQRTPYLLIVSNALPAKERGTCVVDGVVVADAVHLRHLARILRRMVIETHRAGLEGKDIPDKTSRLHDYLCSEEFREELASLIDAGGELNEMLQKERKDHERTWKKREHKYDELVHNSVAIDESIRSIVHGPSGDGVTKRVRRLARLPG